MKPTITFDEIPIILSVLVDKVDSLIIQNVSTNKKIEISENYFTVDEVKEILGVKEGALHNYKVNGDLVPTGRGKYRRYKKEDLQRFLEAKRA